MSTCSEPCSTVKMQNPTGTHDDLAVAVAMVAADLLAQPDLGGGTISRAAGHVGTRSAVTTREALRSPKAGSLAAARLARGTARNMPRGITAIVGVPALTTTHGAAPRNSTAPEHGWFQCSETELVLLAASSWRSWHPI